MAIEKLVAVLPTGGLGAGAAIEWATMETALGTPLPSDYRAFVERYGAGRIAGFVWVFVPGASHDTIDLEVQAAAQREVLAELEASGERIPYPVYPAPGGLLALGMTDNGDVLHWRTVGPPDAWTIVVQAARGPEFVADAHDLTGFLAGILDRTIRCPAFPADFPPDTIGFEAR